MAYHGSAPDPGVPGKSPDARDQYPDATYAGENYKRPGEEQPNFEKPPHHDEITEQVTNRITSEEEAVKNLFGQISSKHPGDHTSTEEEFLEKVIPLTGTGWGLSKKEVLPKKEPEKSENGLDRSKILGTEKGLPAKTANISGNSTKKSSIELVPETASITDGKHLTVEDEESESGSTPSSGDHNAVASGDPD